MTVKLKVVNFTTKTLAASVIITTVPEGVIFVYSFFLGISPVRSNLQQEHQAPTDPHL